MGFDWFQKGINLSNHDSRMERYGINKENDILGGEDIFNPIQSKLCGND